MIQKNTPYFFIFIFFLNLHAGYQLQRHSLFKAFKSAASPYKKTILKGTYFVSGTSLGVLGCFGFGSAYENGKDIKKYIFSGLLAASGAALLWKSGILKPSAIPQPRQRMKSEKYPLFAALVNTMLYNQKVPLCDFARYAGGAGSMLYAT